MIKNRLLVLAGLVLTLSLSAPKNVFCSAAPETAKDARERLEPLFFELHDRALNDADLQIIKDYASNSVRYFVSHYQEDMQFVASFVNTTIDNLVNSDLKAPNKSCKWIIFRCEQIQTLCDVYHHRITEPQGQNLVAAYNKIKDDPTLLLATNRLGRMLGLPPITLRDIPTAEKPAEAPKPLLEAPRRVPPAAHTPSQSASIAGAGAGAGSAGGASAGAADSSSEDAVGQIQRLFTGIQAIVNDPAAMLLKDQRDQATRLAQEAAEIMGREGLSLQTKDNLMSLYRTRIHQKLTDYINEMMGDEGVHRDIGLRGGLAKILQPNLHTIITKHLLNNRGLEVVMPNPEAGAGSSGGAAGGASAGAAEGSSEDNAVGQPEVEKLAAEYSDIEETRLTINRTVEAYRSPEYTAQNLATAAIDDLVRRKTYDSLRRALLTIAVSRQAPFNCSFTKKQEGLIAAAYAQLADLKAKK